MYLNSRKQGPERIKLIGLGCFCFIGLLIMSGCHKKRIVDSETDSVTVENLDTLRGTDSQNGTPPSFSDTDSARDIDSDKIPKEYPIFSALERESCWIHPSDSWISESGTILLAGYASNSSDVSAKKCPLDNGGSDNGWVVRFDGEAWTRVEFPGESNLYHLASICELNSGEVLLWDGMTEQFSVNGVIQDNVQFPEAGTLNFGVRVEDLWCEQDGRVFALSWEGEVYRYEEGQWTAMNTGVETPLLEFSRGVDVMIARGKNNVLLQLEDDQWIPFSMIEPLALQDIWISREDVAYAVAVGAEESTLGAILLWQNEQWRTLIETNDRLLSIGGDDAGAIYAVGTTDQTGIAVVWEKSTNGWQRTEYEYPGTEIEEVACTGPGKCYAFRSDFFLIEL